MQPNQSVRVIQKSVIPRFLHMQRAVRGALNTNLMAAPQIFIFMPHIVMQVDWPPDFHLISSSVKVCRNMKVFACGCTASVPPKLLVITSVVHA